MELESERRAWVEAYAERIEAVGLSSLALVLLEVSQALGFVGSQALLLVQPLIAGAVGSTTLSRAVCLLESPDLLEHMRTYLERREC